MIKIVDQTVMLGGRRGKKNTERGLVAWEHIDISCPSVVDHVFSNRALLSRSCTTLKY
jgi:hypothetical protein